MNDATATHVGYLNSFTNADAFSATINMVCQYPIFSAVDGSLTGSTHCEIFQVIK